MSEPNHTTLFVLNLEVLDMNHIVTPTRPDEVAAVLENWRREAKEMTYDPACSLVDLEWLGGRISALDDVLLLLSGEESTQGNLAARLLGEESLQHLGGSRNQTASETAEDHTRSKLST